MTVVGSATLQLLGDSSQFIQAMNRAGQKWADVGSRIEKVGSTLTLRLTTALVGATAAPLAAADAVQGAMSEIARSTGASGDALQAFGADFRAVFAQVPQSARDVGVALGDVNTRLGLTGEQLRTVTMRMLEFARINNADVAQTTRTISRLMNALEMDADEAAAVLDKLQFAAQKTGISVLDLAEGITDAGLQFQNMGYDIDGAIALFSQFERVGARPADVISSLNQVVTTLAKEGFNDAESAFNELLQRIKDAPHVMEATRIAAEYFGSRVGGKLVEEIRGGTFEIDEFVQALQGAGGTVAATAAASETFRERMAKLRNEITLILEPLGDSLMVAFEDLVSIARPIVTALGELGSWFAELPKPIRTTVIALGALVGAAGPALFALGSFITVAPSVAVGIAGIGTAVQFALGPIGWLGLAVGSLLAAYQAWKKATGDQADANTQLTQTIDEKRAALKKLTGEQLQQLEAQLMANIARRNEITLAKSDVMERNLALLKEERELLREVRALMESRQTLDPIGLPTETVTTVAKDVTDVIGEWQTSLRSAQQMHALLGSSFDETAARANAYRRVVEDLIELGVDHDAVVGPQGETLRQLAASYLRLDGAVRAAADAEKLRAEGVELTRAVMNEEEKFLAVQQRLQTMLDAGAISQDTFNKALNQAREEYEKTTDAAKRMVELKEELKWVLDAIATPTERFSDRLATLDEMLEAGLLTAEQYARALTLLQDDLTRALGSAAPVFDQLKARTQDIAMSMADAFTDFAMGSKAAIGDFVKSAIRDLGRLLARALLVRALTSAFPGIGPVLGMGSIPGRAHGGPVRRGQPYLVGERGPELIVPNAAANVVSNAALAGGGVLRLDASSLPERPRAMTPDAVANDDWWRRAFSSLYLDRTDRGGL